MANQNPNSNRQFLGALAVVALLPYVAYMGVRHNSFAPIDDGGYVWNNPNVITGLTWENVRWAFRTHSLSNYHPLTWLSFQLDCTLFGVKPALHHIVNLYFHVANAVLFFLFLLRVKHKAWAAAIPALVFSVHPMHVESVAWISERKDVLSMFMMWLAIHAYLSYTQSKHKRFLWLSVLLMGIGLMAKSMLVTLPILLFLLDFWPLCRSSIALRTRLLEKLPHLILSVAWSLITIQAQASRGALRSLSDLHTLDRMFNAAWSYVVYLGQLVWPHQLIPFYPLEIDGLWLRGSVGIAVLAAVTLFLFFKRSQLASLWMGWLWFGCSLIPVIGLVQVGDQAHANRYAYIPYLGLYMVLWGVTSLPRPRVWTLITIAIIAGLAIKTSKQVAHWRNAETLVAHTLRVDPKNSWANLLMGDIDQHHGRDKQAIAHYRKAIRSQSSSEAHLKLAKLLRRQGEIERAEREFLIVVELAPESVNAVVALYQLGEMRWDAGDINGASQYFRQSVALDVNAIGGLLQLARLQRLQGNVAQAEEILKDILARGEGPVEYRGIYNTPECVTLSHLELASIYLDQGDYENSQQHALQVLRRDHGNPTARAIVGELSP